MSAHHRYTAAPTENRKDWANIRALLLILPNTFEYYFIFTGIHLLHVVIGIGLLIYLFKRLSTVSQVNQDHLPIEEGVACYWHMVDMVWLMLFALFYLLP